MVINPKKALGTLFCALTLFLLAFVNYNGATEFFDMTVPFIEGHVIVVHFFTSIVFVVLLILVCLWDRNFRVDSVAVGLLIKAFIDAIPFFNDKVEVFDYFWHWSCTAAAIITYIVILNAKFSYVDLQRIKRFLILFGMILTFQVIYTFFNCNYEYLNLKYKIAMVIPYGGSNIIASALLPLLFLIYYSIEKKVLRLGMAALVLVAIVMTKSRGAMLYGAAVIFLCLYQDNKQSSKAVIKNIFLILAVVFLAGALISDDSFLTLMKGFQTGNTLTASGFTSGRTSLWGEMLSSMFNSNIFFGVGMKSLAGHTAGAHNVIIDAFYKGGIIGGLNYLIVLIRVCRCSIECMKTKDKALGVMPLVLVGNMLFEVNYFSYNCDVFFWVIVGLMMTCYYRNDEGSYLIERTKV